MVERSLMNGRGKSICKDLGVCKNLGCYRLCCNNVSSRKTERGTLSVVDTATSLAPRKVPMIHSC